MFFFYLKLLNSIKEITLSKMITACHFRGLRHIYVFVRKDCLCVFRERIIRLIPAEGDCVRSFRGDKLEKYFTFPHILSYHFFCSTHV